jgi:hypothetical protein
MESWYDAQLVLGIIVHALLRHQTVLGHWHFLHHHGSAGVFPGEQLGKLPTSHDY